MFELFELFEQQLKTFLINSSEKGKALPSNAKRFLKFSITLSPNFIQSLNFSFARALLRSARRLSKLN